MTKIERETNVWDPIQSFLCSKVSNFLEYAESTEISAKIVKTILAKERLTKVFS